MKYSTLFVEMNIITPCMDRYVPKVSEQWNC